MSTRPTTTALTASLVFALSLVLSGCAGTGPSNMVEEPGVTVRVIRTSGESFSGTLVGMDGGALVVDHSFPKSVHLSVVRQDGRDVVLHRGVPVGVAVEVRDVDIVVRERLAFFEVEDVEVVSRAYFGWGTGVAAGLAFFLVQILEDVEF